MIIFFEMNAQYDDSVHFNRTQNNVFRNKKINRIVFGQREIRQYNASENEKRKILNKEYEQL